MINNPNNGITTTKEEVLEGMDKMKELVSPYMELDFACVKEDLYADVRAEGVEKLLPIKLYLTYEWLQPGISAAPRPCRG